MKWLKDYAPLKCPNNMGDGLFFSFATGKVIDFFGEKIGIIRRKFFFVKEPDFLYKTRVRNHAIKRIQNFNNCINK